MGLRKLIGALASALIVAYSPQPGAQTYPSRPVTLVVPFPTGGAPDTIGRIVGEKIASNWGTPVVIETRPGAAGTIATTYVARSDPDGYTLLLATLSHVTNPGLLKNVPWDPVADFAGVAEMVTAPGIAVVPASLPVTTLKEFVEYAKHRPGQLNYLMPGVGTSMHLNTELLKLAAGIDLVAIPYKGMTLGLPDLLSGQLSFTMSPVPVVLSQVNAGKLKALAAAAPKRIAQLPGVPTFAEAGFPDAQVVSWYAIVVHAKTPRDIVSRLNFEINKVLADREVRDRLEKIGTSVSEPTTPEQVDTMLRTEVSRWSRVFQQIKIERQ
jgi:tripartite-type tricarboxylate transporter receptor subunit TctC